MKINLAALSFVTETSDKRPVTSKAVNRPVREIMAGINEQVRKNAWGAVLTNIASLYGETVDAKGASWVVNHDEAARAIRVNYNLIQPDYFPKKVSRKMTKEQSQDVWRQIAEQLGLDDVEFTEIDEQDSDE